MRTYMDKEDKHVGRILSASSSEIAKQHIGRIRGRRQWCSLGLSASLLPHSSTQCHSTDFYWR